MSEVSKAQLRALDTNERVAARMRKWRATKSKNTRPRNAKNGYTVTENGREGLPVWSYAKVAWRAGQRLCRWCGLSVPKGTGEGHHILPRAEGGGDEPANLALVHKGECHDGIEGLTMILGRGPTTGELSHARELFSRSVHNVR